MAKHYNKKNDTLLTVIVAILVAIILGVGVIIIGYVSRDASGKWFSNSDLGSWHWADNKEEENGNKDDNKGEDNGNLIITGGDSCDLSFKDGESNGLQLLSAKLPTSAYEANGIDTSKTAYKVTAIVTPETANNKAVDWLVEWADPLNEFAVNKIVTDFVTVTPDYDGALSATVVCENAFEGDIVIIVKTREGGYTAEKFCTFIGKPTIINIDSSEVSINEGSASLSVGQTYVFDISQNNAYNSIGDEYNDVILGGCIATGTLTVGTYDSGQEIDGSHWIGLHQIELSEIADDIITYSLEDSKLTVTIDKNIESYYKSRTYGGRAQWVYTDKVYSIDSDCYFTFYINNAKIGINVQCQLKISIDTSSVSDVEFTDDSIIEF